METGYFQDELEITVRNLLPERSDILEARTGIRAFFYSEFVTRSVRLLRLMPLLFPHWFLDCPENHAIPIPRPIPKETLGYPQMKPTDTPVLNVLCHECGIVYGRSRLWSMGGNQDAGANPFVTDNCLLASAQVQCDGENCEAPKTVHLILEKHEGIYRPKIDPEKWRFDESARCDTGEHRLHLPKGKKLLGEFRGELSF